MMVQSATLQPLLKKLRSAVVRSYVQGGARDMLNEMMDESAARLDNEVEKGGDYSRESNVGANSGERWQSAATTSPC
jgi:hypothetical protein